MSDQEAARFLQGLFERDSKGRMWFNADLKGRRRAERCMPAVNAYRDRVLGSDSRRWYIPALATGEFIIDARYLGEEKAA